MNILILNGSPKGERSNTFRLAKAFSDGINAVSPAECEVIDVYKLNLHECRGCFACWKNASGECIIDDDMKRVIQKILKADIVIWSFPLYFFGMPSRIKMVLDRSLPMSLPFMEENNISGGHPTRYDMSGKKYAVISTCGFYTAEGNYAAVNAQFDRIYGTDGYVHIYCGQGELFNVPELAKRTNEYLEYVKRAGNEFAAGDIGTETAGKLKQLLFPRETYEQMADASWGIEKTAGGKTEKIDDALVFTKQLAALYNKNSWNGKDNILEFAYTDVKKRYQIVLGKDGSNVLSKDFMLPTTKIETPFTVWKRIGSGELDGACAMAEHLYTVTGDFNIMINWDKYFGTDMKEGTAEKTIPAKKTNMLLLLIPWMTLFIGLPINAYWGGIAALAVSMLLPLAFLKYKITVFEALTAPSVSVIALFSVLGYSSKVLLPVSQLIFALMWTVTAFMKIPLSAWYSMNRYGMEKALKNPLFIRTNRILTACWGVLFLFSSVWTYLLADTVLTVLAEVLNICLPILMSVFTVWFRNRYPKHYAAKSYHRNRSR